MKKKLLFVLLVSVLAATGCADRSRNFEVNSDDVAVVASKAELEITSGITEDADYAEGDIIVNSTNGDVVLREEYRRYYEQFYPLIQNYLNISHPEALLMNMSSIYNENLNNYYHAVAYEANNFQKTSHSNYTENDFTDICKYDPFCLAFYRAKSELLTNPIQTAEMADKKYSYGKHQSTDYLPFNYNFMPVENNNDFSVPEKAIAEIVEEYFEIHADDVIVGYSPEEALYYTYVIDADGKENSFVICSLFFDVQNNDVKRIGVETYVRSHSELNAHFSDNTTPVANGTCLIDCLNTPFLCEPYDANNPADTISENLIVTEHKDFCDIAGSIMMNSSFSQTHSVKFSFLDDFHSAMNSHPHFFSVHYVSWFTKN